MILGKAQERVFDFSRVNRLGLTQFVLMVGAFIYLYASVIPPLVSDWWEDPNYSHGFIIPFLSAFIIWERRRKLLAAPFKPHSWGMALILLALSLLFLGSLGADLFLMRFSMIFMITGLVLFLFGGEILKILFFPIVFLIFMIPLPAIVLNAMTFPLQLVAAQMSTFCLQAINIPVFRDGNIIFLPRTTLEVAEACSGIRSLVSLTALAVVFAYATQRNIWKRSALVFSAIPIAIIANAFRIWGTGVLAHLYGVEMAEGFYHTFAGWLVFVVALGVLLIEGFVFTKLKPTLSERGGTSR